MLFYYTSVFLIRCTCTRCWSTILHLSETGSAFLNMVIVNFLKVKNDLRSKFTAMIILHFHLQPQFKNELFHILHIIVNFLLYLLGCV